VAALELDATVVVVLSTPAPLVVAEDDADVEPVDEELVVDVEVDPDADPASSTGGVPLDVHGSFSGAVDAGPAVGQPSALHWSSFSPRTDPPLFG
jgi:hypothetical protein